MKEKSGFSVLSENIVDMLYEVLDNDNLVKYIYYSKSKPLEESNLSQEEKRDMVNEYIYPVPFSPNVTITQSSQLRIFYPDGELNNRVILGSEVAFQIIIHKNLWLIREEVNGEEKERIRPYQMMDEIVKTFKDRSIGKIGILHFTHYVYRYLDDEHGMYELFSETKTL